MKEIPYIPGRYGNASREELANALVNISKALLFGSADTGSENCRQAIERLLPALGLPAMSIKDKELFCDSDDRTYEPGTRYIDPRVSISVTGRRIRVDAIGAMDFEKDAPSHMSDASLDDDTTVRMLALVMLLPLTLKFTHEAPEWVEPWMADDLARFSTPDRGSRRLRSLRGAMTAAGVASKAQQNIFAALSELEPDMFK